ncbi:nucleoside deaminase [Oligoflexaceae bacterium]|nr:nucleoside deaminase [Oligoflexaceae bacterium]
MNHATFIRQTLNLAKSARCKRNHPFGALLEHKGKVVLTAENSVVSDRDVTRHAELNLVSRASKIYSRQHLGNCTLYTSTEPCVMCCGAIYWSGIRNVIFGLPAKELGKLTSGSFVVESNLIFSRGKERVNLEGPILFEESREVHLGFWN